MKKAFLLVVGFALVFVFQLHSAFASSEVTGSLCTGIGCPVEGTVVAAPTASLAAGTYSSTQSVTLISSGSSGICYTTSGTDPVCTALGTSCTTGILYSSAISVTSTQTIKAISCYSNDNHSSVDSYAYTISVAAAGGSYTSPTTTTTTTTTTKPVTTTTTKPTTTTTTKPVSISACQWCGLACIKLQSWMYCPALTPASGYICTEVNNVCSKVFGVATTTTTTTTVPPGDNTVSSLQARIAELQSMINNLLRQLGLPVTTIATVPGVTTTTIPPVTITGIPEGFTFQKDLWDGKVNEDVRYLQMFLNSHAGTKIAETGVGSPGQETNYFGSLTQAALARFQASVGISPAVGYFGPLTREYINTH